MERYAEIVSYLGGHLNSRPWAITQRAQWAVREELSGLLTGRPTTDAAVRGRILGLGYDEEPAPRQPVKTSGVAIIRVSGFLFPEPNFLTDFGWGTALSDVVRMYRQAIADQSVGSIVLCFNSPGGCVEGGEELWSELFASRAVKRTVSQVSYTCGSLAYLLATATGEIVLAPSASAGSIGCFMVHEDLSKMLEMSGVKVTFINSVVGPYKLEGNPYEPLDEEAQANRQTEVDAFGQYFVRAVAKGRGVSTAEVLKNFGQGRMVMARDAVARGMADRIGTVDEVVSKLAGKKPAGRVAAAFGTMDEIMTEVVLHGQGAVPGLVTDPAGPPGAVAPALEVEPQAATWDPEPSPEPPSGDADRLRLEMELLG